MTAPSGPGPDHHHAAGAVAAVMAVKRLDAAKSRLASSLPAPGGLHGALVLAMLSDTIGAVRRAGIDRLVVVSPDDDVLATAHAAGAVGLREDDTQRSADATPGRLNLALSAAETAARLRWHDLSTIVFIQADLPAATAAGLREVLTAAAGHPQAMVTDREATGTTILIRASSIAGPPRFGPNSAAAHRAAGAVELDPGHRRWPDLRTDVDTAADLEAARLIGLGPRTAAELSGRPVAASDTSAPARRCG
ncbi:2-phospho-L-lactate guanylyltransferase [Gordonia sp. NPDC003424]